MINIQIHIGSMIIICSNNNYYMKRHYYQVQYFMEKNMELPIILFSFIFREMDGAGYTIALGVLRAFAFLYDVLTFPVYVILQRPWRVRQLSRRVKVSSLQSDTFRLSASHLFCMPLCVTIPS